MTDAMAILANQPGFDSTSARIVLALLEKWERIKIVKEKEEHPNDWEILNRESVEIYLSNAVRYIQLDDWFRAHNSDVVYSYATMALYHRGYVGVRAPDNHGYVSNSSDGIRRCTFTLHSLNREYPMRCGRFKHEH